MIAVCRRPATLISTRSRSMTNRRLVGCRCKKARARDGTPPDNSALPAQGFAKTSSTGDPQPRGLSHAAIHHCPLRAVGIENGHRTSCSYHLKAGQAVEAKIDGLGIQRPAVGGMFECSHLQFTKQCWDCRQGIRLAPVKLVRHHNVSGNRHGTLVLCAAMTGWLVRCIFFFAHPGRGKGRGVENETSANVDRSIDFRVGLAKWCNGRHPMRGQGLCRHLSGAKEPTRDGAEKERRP